MSERLNNEGETLTRVRCVGFASKAKCLVFRCHWTVGVYMSARMNPCVPEAAGARPHGGRSPALFVSDALGAEVLGEEVQLVRGGLEGQLVQLLLG